jgi:hypothetical protein
MSRELDRFLDTCIGDIQTGKASVESCLERYPQASTALEPLLRLAEHSQKVLAPEGPNSAYVAATHTRLMNRILIPSAQKKRRVTETLVSRWLSLRPAYVIAVFSLVITLFASSIGVVRASADSLPGDDLYGVKLASEQVQLAISLSSERDRTLLIQFAEQRMMEAARLLDLERYDDLDLAMRGLDESIEKLIALSFADDDPVLGSVAPIEANLEKHLETLQRVLDQVPESARKAIEKAIERSNHSQELIKKMKPADHPSNTAPGKLKKDADEDRPSNDHPGQGNGQDKLKPEKTEKP